MLGILMSTNATIAPPDTTRVWISAGCICCHWCQHLIPEVFQDGAGGCQIRGSAREDGVTDDNLTERSRLRSGAIDAKTEEFLSFVAGGCPSQVIHVERDSASGP